MDMPIPDGFLSVRDKPLMAKAVIESNAGHESFITEHMRKLMTADELRADHDRWLLEQRNRLAAEKVALRQPPTAPQILDAAAGHMRDRAATYDTPGGERSMGQAVAVFNLHHGTALTEAQGWHFMAVLKQVRAFQRGGYHADSIEDCAAYVALMGEAMGRRNAA